MINQRSKKPFEIELDKLIVIPSSDVKKENLPQGESFQRRFSIIEFPCVNTEFLINEIEKSKKK